MLGQRLFCPGGEQFELTYTFHGFRGIGCAGRRYHPWLHPAVPSGRILATRADLLTPPRIFNLTPRDFVLPFGHM